MFQFPGFASICMDIPINRDGLPHSDTRGSTLLCSSPRIFAAWHVLHRHCMPRHPPYALFYFVLAWLAQGVPAPIQSTLAYMSSICYLDLKKNHCACSRIHIFIHLLPLRQRTSPPAPKGQRRCKMPGNRAPLQPIAQKKTATAVHFKINKFSSLLPSCGATRFEPRGTASQHQRLVFHYHNHSLRGS